MTIEVRYQSKGGNTKAVAEVIANNLGVKAESIESPVSKKVDILFVGGGVYMNKMDESLRNFIQNLNSENIGQIVCFSTTGFTAAAIKQMKALATQKGIKINENELLLKMLWRGHSALGLTGGKLNNKQIKEIEDFTNNILN